MGYYWHPLTAFSLNRMEEALGKQVELGAAVHLAFEQLQAIDLSFSLAVAPRQLQGRLNGLKVREQTDGEAAHLGCGGHSAGPYNPATQPAASRCLTKSQNACASSAAFASVGQRRQMASRNACS